MQQPPRPPQGCVAEAVAHPPRMSATECSCRLCPSPGMYAVTVSPFISLTLATFLSAEFGFFGVVV